MKIAPNKIIYDIYSTGGGLGMTRDEYAKYYAENDIVYIILVDECVFTRVKRSEMFENNLHLGCFIEHRPSMTADESHRRAIATIKSINAREVTPQQFVEIERRDNDSRTASAFATAEKLIKEN